MATEKQTAANRKNAKKSAGPKTPEGKTISSRNAIKHGILCEVPGVLPWEDPREYDEMCEQLFQDLQPQGEMERFWVAKTANLMWRLRRAEAWEPAILTCRVLALAGRGPNPYCKPVAKLRIPDGNSPETPQGLVLIETVEPPPQPTLCEVGRAFMVDVQEGEPLSKVRRHETSLENSLRRALLDLERLQAKRKAPLVTPPAPAAIDVPAAGQTSAEDLKEKAA